MTNSPVTYATKFTNANGHGLLQERIGPASDHIEFRSVTHFSAHLDDHVQFLHNNHGCFTYCLEFFVDAAFHDRLLCFVLLECCREYLILPVSDHTMRGVFTERVREMKTILFLRTLPWIVT